MTLYALRLFATRAHTRCVIFFFLSFSFLILLSSRGRFDGSSTCVCDEIHRHVVIITANGPWTGPRFVPRRPVREFITRATVNARAYHTQTCVSRCNRAPGDSPDRAGRPTRNRVLRGSNGAAAFSHSLSLSLPLAPVIGVTADPRRPFDARPYRDEIKYTGHLCDCGRYILKIPYHPVWSITIVLISIEVNRRFVVFNGSDFSAFPRGTVRLLSCPCRAEWGVSSA